MKNKFNLTEAQLTKISTLHFPSVARDSAIVLLHNNLYDKYIAAATEAEDRKLYEEAKSYYLAAKEIKPNEKKWDKKIDELDKQISLEVRRKQMTAKYGSNYGAKIAEGIIEIGMTKAMVKDAFGVDDVLLNAYHISTSKDWSENIYETWEYDYKLAKNYIDKKMGDDALNLNLLLELGSAMGLDFRTELSNAVKYKYLRFKNNKLIELKDSSIYDDIDNATNDINNYLRMLN